RPRPRPAFVAGRAPARALDYRRAALDTAALLLSEFRDRRAARRYRGAAEGRQVYRHAIAARRRCDAAGDAPRALWRGIGQAARPRARAHPGRRAAHVVYHGLPWRD